MTANAMWTPDAGAATMEEAFESAQRMVVQEDREMELLEFGVLA